MGINCIEIKFIQINTGYFFFRITLLFRLLKKFVESFSSIINSNHNNKDFQLYFIKWQILKIVKIKGNQKNYYFNTRICTMV